MVLEVPDAGKSKGMHYGSVTVRKVGTFDVTTSFEKRSASYKECKLLKHFGLASRALRLRCDGLVLQSAC